MKNPARTQLIRKVYFARCFKQWRIAKLAPLGFSYPLAGPVSTLP